ncbi:MAG: [acyl-carrier-protein] S-malonyltransferase [Proteobacteria bacterium]|jgi:[acyl-carrier-protein] S-malonyltransferase|nr:ACP S-malonyltransferase [Alphaproteobacteria bacterium]NCC02498.1 [acyl-carrier-protein] S-malonyltransferase [Pseudomonadota bacterium]
MKRAFIFPGQGSQKIGMGKALYDAYPEAKEVFQEVDDSLNEKLSQLIFEGNEDELKLTPNTQPALMAVSMAVIRVLTKQANLRSCQMASFVAGHSLGEYAALCAVKSLTLHDTAALLRKRGLAMQQAVPVGVGGMAALIGADINAAREIAALSAQDQVCVAANDNADGQIVISGHMEAIDRAIVIAAERGFKRAVKLPVSAPFHSPLMMPAAKVMEEALADVVLKVPCIPVVPNVKAQAESDPAVLRKMLVDQVCGSVRWRETVLYLKEQGIEQLVECGAGSVLTGLTKRIDKSVASVALQTPEDIEAFIEAQGSVLRKEDEPADQVSCCVI